MKIAGLPLNSNVMLGAGMVLLAPVVIPLVAGVLKPVAKAAIKMGMITYHKVKETTAEAIESMEDLAAEAAAEVAEESEPQPKTARKTAKAKAA
jgi:hypothetical protein